MTTRPDDLFLYPASPLWYLYIRIQIRSVTYTDVLSSVCRIYYVPGRYITQYITTHDDANRQPTMIMLRYIAIKSPVNRMDL